MNCFGKGLIEVQTYLFTVVAMAFKRAKSVAFKLFGSQTVYIELKKRFLNLPSKSNNLFAFSLDEHAINIFESNLERVFIRKSGVHLWIFCSGGSNHLEYFPRNVLFGSSISTRKLIFLLL